MKCSFVLSSKCGNGQNFSCVGWDKGIGAHSSTIGPTPIVPCASSAMHSTQRYNVHAPGVLCMFVSKSGDGESLKLGIPRTPKLADVGLEERCSA
eukprot:m.283732 g.283732  ORF g.283732 m.283732 type:complete len:95 (+) comp19883_c0_seq1:149-433(+)